MDDLNAASVEDVASFFKTYYAPNNAVVAIVGDVDTKATIEKVRKAFGPIPSQPQPPPVDLTEPPQKGERRQTLEDGLARLARVDLAYKVPPRLTADDDAIQVLGTVMSSGRSSRLYQQLVRAATVAESVRWTRPDGRARIVLLPGHGRAGQDHRRGREGDPRRDRAAEDDADRAVGAREGAQQRQAWRRRRADQLAPDARTCSPTSRRTSATRG